MKNCLLVGGGSKFGRYLTQALVNAGYNVYLITGSASQPQTNVYEIQVNWGLLTISDLGPIVAKLPELDLIFFNHNSSSLSANMFKPNKMQSFKHWQHSYFVACQMPFYLVHLLNKKINDATKIGWMVSQLIINPLDHEVGYADYIGNKFTNACIMRAFSNEHSSCFFGIHPDGINAEDIVENETKAADMVKLIDSNTVNFLNGNIFSAQGQRLELWKSKS